MQSEALNSMSDAVSNTYVGIGLINPKSPTNVGGVIRATGCYQATDIRYTGQRYQRAVKFQTDTKNSQQNIPLIAVDHLLDDLPENVNIVCVDLIEGATPLPEFQHPDNALYIFGPEDGTIDQSIVDKAHSVTYVPTVGCMNLAASVNVILYDRLAKSGLADFSKNLIRKSRDTNNRVKVKL